MTDLEAGRSPGRLSPAYAPFDTKSTEITINPRLGFVRKVYGILTVQLVVTVIMCVLSMTTNFAQFQQNNIGLLWLSFAVNLVTMLMVFCCTSMARSVPTNYILLGIFTLSEAYMVSAICSVYDPEIVIMAAAMTAAMTFSLTLYACTTKTDVTIFGGTLFILGCGLLLLCLFSFIFPSKILTVFICVACICLYGVYLVYDTQLIVGDKRYELSVDDYIIGAIIIYVDIIVLFLRLLQLLSILRGDNN